MIPAWHVPNTSYYIRNWKAVRRGYSKGGYKHVGSADLASTRAITWQGLRFCTSTRGICETTPNLRRISGEFAVNLRKTCAWMETGNFCGEFKVNLQIGRMPNKLKTPGQSFYFVWGPPKMRITNQVLLRWKCENPPLPHPLRLVYERNTIGRHCAKLTEFAQNWPNLLVIKGCVNPLCLPNVRELARTLRPPFVTVPSVLVWINLSLSRDVPAVP